MVAMTNAPTIRRVETANDQSITIIGRGKESAIEIGTATGLMQIPVTWPEHLRLLAAHLLVEADELERAQKRQA